MQEQQHIEAATRRWLERAVIGLSLCPFAKAVYVRAQVRIHISDADNPEHLKDVLRAELLQLAATPAEQIDTTLLVHPRVLQDFFDYNDFLDEAEALVRELNLEGEIQIASFHPDYQFAGTDPDDAGNNTNRAPYPMLHLLREASIDRAVAAYPSPDSIIERNIATMQRLGQAGYKKLLEP
ncbi:hypothetical protein CO614_03035 [Lysobacteraceae bacterium NML120232]|nr:hypothetical protein CO608_06045 [Xanthomonadaceae bacterium NML08-0793]PJK13031.1 hypothetical protein CO614_03035 [Xanthomonadaceae bacterium NML120232]